MSIINGITTYIEGYSGLETDIPVWVNRLKESGMSYSVQTLPGEKVVEEYIDGSSTEEYPFAFLSNEDISDNIERLATSSFYEEFSAWLRSQTKSGILPTLDAGKTAEKIEAVGFGILLAAEEGETGIYQILCKLTYHQDP